jgi:hypothetical protein
MQRSWLVVSSTFRQQQAIVQERVCVPRPKSRPRYHILTIASSFVILLKHAFLVRKYVGLFDHVLMYIISKSNSI